jgi:hypothetical protein
MRAGTTRSTNSNFLTNMSYQYQRNQYQYAQQELRNEEQQWREIADSQHFRLLVIQSVLVILAFVAFWSWVIFVPQGT